MAPGSSFGGRVLPPFEVYVNLKKIYFGSDCLARPKEKLFDLDEPEEKYQLKSLLNIIADSGVVEIYKITRTELAYLSEKQQS
jgi:hypothetical protein